MTGSGERGEGEREGESEREREEWSKDLKALSNEEKTESLYIQQESSQNYTMTWQSVTKIRRLLESMPSNNSQIIPNTSILHCLKDN